MTRDSSSRRVLQTRMSLGDRLRVSRLEQELSLREVARRIGVSPSLISQIETNKAQPSVRTLYAIVTELGISLDALFGTEGEAEMPWSAEHVVRSVGSHPPIPPVQRKGDRRSVDFAQGVRWESLTALSVPGIEFLYIEYEPGSASSPPDSPQRHPGREWGYVMTGTLDVTVLVDDYVLEPGDAITFASDLPHRLWNRGDETVTGIWFVLGTNPIPPHG